MSEAEDTAALRALVDAYSVGVTTRDSALIARCFGEHGEWRMLGPMESCVSGDRDAVATGVMAILDGFEFIVQMAHSAHIELDGDSAQLTCVMEGKGRRLDGESMHLLGVFHDQARRGAQGWTFLSRRFQPIYLDRTPMPGQYFR